METTTEQEYTRLVIAQTKQQHEFNNKIEAEKIRITDQLNQTKAEKRNWEWTQVGKKGKVIDLQEQSHDLRSEHLKVNRTSRELELVIFGATITKYIIPENICKCDPQHAVNLLKSGAKSRAYTSSKVFSRKNIRTPELRISLHTLILTTYPGIAPKMQLRRYVNYWWVYHISLPVQLFSIPEYY